ncbi:MAG: RidA family protein [Ferruginibacter sp.]
MERTLISSHSTFEKEIAYSRAVVVGDWVFVSGTTGFNYATMTIEPSIEQQVHQCILNIEAALQKADATLSDIVRIQYIVPNADEFELCWPTLRNFFENIRPAATMISAALADPRMKIEIEVTAIKNSGK